MATFLSTPPLASRPMAEPEAPVAAQVTPVDHLIAEAAEAAEAALVALVADYLSLTAGRVLLISTPITYTQAVAQAAPADRARLSAPRSLTVAMDLTVQTAKMATPSSFSFR